jgi:ParB family transcriptional regulator, chromosome partitioning protein
MEHRGNVTEISGEAPMPDDGRSRLGRGLAALIGDVGEETKSTERARAQRRVPIEFLKPNPRNPRKNFSDTELDELVASVRERGVIQPIVVRPVRGSADAFEIIAGERRWRAAQRAGLHDVPIISVDASDAEALELAIIENVQRTDLNAIEEAEGYRALIDEFDHTHDDVAKIVGKSRVHITNTMRLLKLSDTVKAFVHSGKLTAGHARMLVGQPNAVELAEEIVARGLNVRQVEAMARKSGKEQARDVRPKRRTGKDADTVALEKRLSDVLGLQVSVDHRDGWGILQIHYRNLEQLDEVLRKLEQS